MKLTYFFITHDLSVVRQFADRIGVMFLGRLVELGRTEEIFLQPRHPYTMLLISAVPRADPHQRGRERPMLTGEIPSPMNLPPGCRFHTRCPFAQADLPGRGPCPARGRRPRRRLPFPTGKLREPPWI